MINITLPDGSVKQYPEGVTALEVAKGLSEGLARNVLAAKVDEEVWDATRPIHKDCHLTLLTWQDEDGRAAFWHSTAHLAAEAIEQLYPGAKFGIGPHIDTGFYYDIDFGDNEISSDDFPKIEERVMKLAAEKQAFVRKDVSKAEAIKYFTEKGDEYKLDLLNDLADGTITFYTNGTFTDLCRGPHIPDTSFIKAFKLTSIAGAYWRGDEKRKMLTRVGAYWRGDEKRKMLTRVYGVSFPKQKDLKEYLEFLEEAKKRDHRKIGKEMELFTFSPKVGAGLPIWLPNGTAMREQLEKFLKKVQRKAGYVQVMCPHIGNVELYKTSGHYDKYGKDSFQPINTPVEGEQFFLKPMNCPHHCEVYRSKPRSYKDLPLRIAEFGTVYRYEQSGELHGLTRVRGFTQDDAHIFCTADQLKAEFESVIDIILLIFRTLNFKEYSAQISLRDKVDHSKYIGSDENWEKAEKAIIEAAAEKGLNTYVEYGEAAFYGPKLDFMVRDALGRKWQLGTVQVDYNLPERFGLEYVGADNQKHRPIMIHRAPFGSMERFVAVLTENTAGRFPLWLTPVQFTVLPISEKYLDYAKKVKEVLEDQDLRGNIDDRNEKTGRKIRDAEMKHIPYMLVVGEKEAAEGSVSVRKHGEGDLGSMKLEDFAKRVTEEVKEYK